jgi:hypothetical protein
VGAAGMTTALDERIADLEIDAAGTAAATINDLLAAAGDLLQDAKDGNAAGIGRANEQLAVCVDILNALRERLRLLEEEAIHQERDARGAVRTA